MSRRQLNYAKFSYKKNERKIVPYDKSKKPTKIEEMKNKIASLEEENQQLRRDRDFIKSQNETFERLWRT